MSNGWVLPDELLRDAPAYTPRPYELADLELLLSGAYAPLSGFLGRADLASVARRGRLADATPGRCRSPCRFRPSWSAARPEQPAGAPAGPDRPGGRADRRCWRSPTCGRPGHGWYGVGGPVRRIGDGGHGPFRRLRRTPAEVRQMLPPGRVLGVIADRPLHRPQLAQIAHAVRTLAAHLLILIPVAENSPDGLPPEVLVRCVFGARDRMPPATIVAVPLRPTRRRDLGRPAAGPGGPRLRGHPRPRPPTEMLTGGGLRVLVPRELAYDNRDGQWRWRDDIPPRNRRLALTQEEIDDLLDRGFPLPEWHTPPAVATELSRARPPRRQRGPGGLLHRPLRIRQVDDRPRARRRAAGERRPDGHPARRRRGTPGALRGARFQQGRPGPQRPPHRLGRRRGGPAPRAGDLLPDRAVRASPGGRPGDRPGGGGRFRAGPRRDPARGLRAARPQGAVRAGAGRPAHRDDRHRRPVRGADRRRSGDGHHRRDGRGGCRTVLRLPDRDRLGGAALQPS